MAFPPSFLAAAFFTALYPYRLIIKWFCVGRVYSVLQAPIYAKAAFAYKDVGSAAYNFCI